QRQVRKVDQCWPALSGESLRLLRYRDGLERQRPKVVLIQLERLVALPRGVLRVGCRIESTLQDAVLGCRVPTPSRALRQVRDVDGGVHALELVRHFSARVSGDGQLVV